MSVSISSNQLPFPWLCHPNLTYSSWKADWISYTHTPPSSCRYSGIPTAVGPQLFCSASQSESRFVPQGRQRTAFHSCDAQAPPDLLSSLLTPGRLLWTGEQGWLTAWPMHKQHPATLCCGMYLALESNTHSFRVQGKKGIFQSSDHAQQQAVEVHLASQPCISCIHTITVILQTQSPDACLWVQRTLPRNQGEGKMEETRLISWQELGSPSLTMQNQEQVSSWSCCWRKQREKSHILLRSRAKLWPTDFCLRFGIA